MFPFSMFLALEKWRDKQSWIMLLMDLGSQLTNVVNSPVLFGHNYVWFALNENTDGI